MNVLASECSSGCESSWAFYLDQSHSEENGSYTHRVDRTFVSDKCKGKKSQDDEEEEEDLSMVSDASSGPPHFQEDQEENYSNANGGFFFQPTTLTKSNGKRKKNTGNKQFLDQQLAFLDDTASSPAFNNSTQNNCTFTKRRTSMESVLEFSQDVSTPFQGGSAFQGNYGYMQSSYSGNQFENNQWLTRR